MNKELLENLELNRIYQMDCIEGMKLIPDKSVNLILIDPPYNIGKDKWDKWNSIEDYVEFMGKVFKECERVLKENGSFYWFHNDFEQMSELQCWIKRNTKFIHKSLITIDKLDNNYIKDLYGSQEHFRNYLNIAEYLCYYTFEENKYGYRHLLKKENESISPFSRIMKQKMKVLNISQRELSMLQLSRNGKPTGWISNKLNGSEIPTREQWDLICNKFGIENKYDDLLLERELLINEIQDKMCVFNKKDGLKNVWSYYFRDEKQYDHKTQKPISLIEDIIKYSSNENDVVLDCFMGSGTTAEASLNTKRKFIGFETESKYIEITNKRLDNLELN